MKTIYITNVRATGGRNSHVKSKNGVLDIQVRFPKTFGGVNDDFINPEMLFAAGCSACFDGALNLVIQNSKITTRTTLVDAKVSIGQIENGGYQLAVVLHINIPNVSVDKAKSLAEEAPQIFPYSNATRENIKVVLKITNH
jgi:Ohr subfamily peroxiredoxin